MESLILGMLWHEIFQGEAPRSETLLLRHLQEAICGEVQPGEPHVAAQEPEATALQVHSMQKGKEESNTFRLMVFLLQYSGN